MTERMLACTKCGLAFPELDEEMAKQILEDGFYCPYCHGELKWHRVVEK